MSEKRMKSIFKEFDRNKILHHEVLVTVREAAMILKCHRMQIYDYVKNDYLTAVCPNGPGTRPMNIRTDSLRNFIDNYSFGGPFAKTKANFNKE